jgi:hypothetical protein
MGERGQRWRVGRFGALLLIASLVFTAGAVYKWVDKEGRVHYSDQPPPGVDAQPVHVDPGPTLEQQTQARQRVQAVLEAQRAEAERASTAAREQPVALVAEDPSLTAWRCADALAQRKTLDLQMPVYRRRGPGEFEYLADADRPAEKQKLDEAIGTYCSDDPAQAPLVQQRFVELSLGRRPACVELRDELQERVLRGETSTSEGVQRVATRLQQFRCPDSVPVDGVWLAKEHYQLQAPRD